MARIAFPVFSILVFLSACALDPSVDSTCIVSLSENDLSPAISHEPYLHNSLSELLEATCPTPETQELIVELQIILPEEEGEKDYESYEDYEKSLELETRRFLYPEQLAQEIIQGEFADTAPFKVRNIKGPIRIEPSPDGIARWAAKNWVLSGSAEMAQAALEKIAVRSYDELGDHCLLATHPDDSPLFLPQPEAAEAGEEEDNLDEEEDTAEEPKESCLPPPEPSEAEKRAYSRKIQEALVTLEEITTGAETTLTAEPDIILAGADPGATLSVVPARQYQSCLVLQVPPDWLLGVANERGDIVSLGHENLLVVENDYGDTEIAKEGTGPVVVHAAHGDVSLLQAGSGHLQIKNGVGATRLWLQAFENDSLVQADSGEIDLCLAPELGVTLEATVQTGIIEVPPHWPPPKETDWVGAFLNHAINGGGATLKLQMESGLMNIQ